MEREGMVGMAVAGGAALVIGGLVGLGIALAKKWEVMKYCGDVFQIIEN